jgi:hypothetical protein
VIIDDQKFHRQVSSSFKAIRKAIASQSDQDLDAGTDRFGIALERDFDPQSIQSSGACALDPAPNPAILPRCEARKVTELGADSI